MVLTIFLIEKKIFFTLNLIEEFIMIHTNVNEKKTFFIFLLLRIKFQFYLSNVFFNFFK